MPRGGLRPTSSPLPGYMQSQAERLLGTRSRSGHGGRGGDGREELLAAHGYDTKYAMQCARHGFLGRRSCWGPVDPSEPIARSAGFPWTESQ